MDRSPNHPNWKRCSIETHGFGMTYFKKAPLERFQVGKDDVLVGGFNMF